MTYIELKDRWISVRLTETDIEKIKELADYKETTKSNIIRTALKDYYYNNI